MNELLQDYGSTKVEKDKEMREFDEKMKELSAGFSASEKQRILMEVSSVAKDLSRKMEEKCVKDGRTGGEGGREGGRERIKGGIRMRGRETGRTGGRERK